MTLENIRTVACSRALCAAVGASLVISACGQPNETPSDVSETPAAATQEAAPESLAMGGAKLIAANTATAALTNSALTLSGDNSIQADGTAGNPLTIPAWSGTGTMTLNGSYFATASRISSSVDASSGGPTITTCVTPA